jgi:hypothetical protein
MVPCARHVLLGAVYIKLAVALGNSLRPDIHVALRHLYFFNHFVDLQLDVLHLFLLEKVVIFVGHFHLSHHLLKLLFVALLHSCFCFGVGQNMHFVEGLLLTLGFFHPLIPFYKCRVLIKVFLTYFFTTLKHLIHLLISLFKILSFFSMIHSVGVKVGTETIWFERQNFFRFW